jgi:hypothetical protein
MSELAFVQAPAILEAALKTWKTTLGKLEGCKQL